MTYDHTTAVQCFIIYLGLTFRHVDALVWRRYSNVALHLLGCLKHSNVTLQLGESG